MKQLNVKNEYERALNEINEVCARWSLYFEGFLGVRMEWSSDITVKPGMRVRVFEVADESATRCEVGNL